jgi:orotate phosphoribosyltransferase
MEHLGPRERTSATHPELVWLRKTIVERALTRGDYLLSGGIRSDYYIDKFSLFSEPHVLRRIARLFTPIVSEINPDIIGGTELGGVVIATAVSFR